MSEGAGAALKPPCQGSSQSRAHRKEKLQEMELKFIWTRAIKTKVREDPDHSGVGESVQETLL